MQAYHCAMKCVMKAYAGFIIDPYGRCYCENDDSETCLRKTSGTTYTRYDFKQNVVNITECEYVSPEISNNKPCICGNEVCDYKSGLRCDWSLLGQKQLSKVHSVCSISECVLNQRLHEPCKCQDNICPSGSVCTNDGLCVYDIWTKVISNISLAPKTEEKMVRETILFQ